MTKPTLRSSLHSILNFNEGGAVKHVAIGSIVFRLVLVFYIFALGGFVLQNLCAITINGWPIGELLVNYEGGFVRRGLFGQFFLETGHPVIAANLAQKIMISFFFAGCGLILLLWKNSFPALAAFLLVIFAPGGLFDMASSGTFEYLDRKEVWFYVSAIVMVFYAKAFGTFSFSTALFFSVISFLMILHHELFFIYYSIPISAILIFGMLLSKKRQFAISALLYLSITTLTFLVTVLNPGTTETVAAMLGNYEGTDASGILGGMEAIGWSLATSHGLTQQMVTQGSVVYWMFFLLMAVLFVINTVVVASRNYFTLFISCFFMIWLLAAIGISAWAGWDWGRWISMYSITFFLLFALLQVTETGSFETGRLGRAFDYAATIFIRRSWSTNILSMALMSFLVFLSISTRMSHCCPQNSAINLFGDNLIGKVLRQLMSIGGG